jgi:hypothetical protein
MFIISRRIAERAAAYLAPADEIGPMCEMVTTTFLDHMMAGISSTEASRLLYRMIDRIDLLGDHLLHAKRQSAGSENGISGSYRSGVGPLRQW